MIRRYKAFGLVLMALVALGAVAAQGASASPLTVSGVAKVFITGTTHEGGPKHVLTSTTSVECKVAHYSGSAAVVGGQVNEITLTPTYTECSAFGFATAHVKTNECHYTLTTPTKIKTGEVTWGKEQIHVLCTGGKKIEITPTSFGVSVCTQFIDSQTPTAGHLVARNAGTATAMDLTDEATVEGITYTGTGGACGTHGTNAKFTGTTTSFCYSDEKHTVKVDCTFS